MMLGSLFAQKKNYFLGGQKLTAVEENGSVYQVNAVSRITGEGRAEFQRARGPDFDQRGRGEGEGGDSWAAQFVGGN